MNPLISVIVPVYGVEKYICESMDSVLKQTYKNIEIILVDDGSPDNCPQICDEYAKKDPRVVVIHQKNAGVSAARNAGLEAANGEYIGFVDPDDIVFEYTFETMLNEIVQADADVIICDYKRIDEEGNDIGRDFKCPLKNEICSCSDIMHRMADNNEDWYWTINWNRLYKKHVFDGVRFPEGKSNEDNYIAQDIYAKCKRIVSTDRQLYIYRVREHSLVHGPFNIRHMDFAESYMRRMQFCLDNGYEFLIPKSEDRCFRQFVSGYRKANFKDNSVRARFDELYDMYADLYPKIKAYCHFSMVEILSRVMMVRFNFMFRNILRCI